jgi:hypothetical protein
VHVVVSVGILLLLWCFPTFCIRRRIRRCRCSRRRPLLHFFVLRAACACSSSDMPPTGFLPLAAVLLPLLLLPVLGKEVTLIARKDATLLEVRLQV